VAIAQRANKIYIDSTGVVTTDRVKVAYILFTPSATHDYIELKETSTDVPILKIQGNVDHNTMYFRFDEAPLLFNNGIYVSHIDSGATAILVTTSAGPG
jgi:hypothetical protein